MLESKKFNYFFSACSMHIDRNLGSRFDINKINYFFVNSIRVDRDLFV